VQSRAAFERQYLTDSFYLYHSFSVIVARPLSFTNLAVSHCVKIFKEKMNKDKKVKNQFEKINSQFKL
jgi:hypothetical protein